MSLLNLSYSQCGTNYRISHILFREVIQIRLIEGSIIRNFTVVIHLVHTHFKFTNPFKLHMI